jgi:hypothetical protein
VLKIAAAAALLSLLSGCALKVLPRFSEVGELGTASAREPIVGSPDAVAIHYKSAPAGFVVRDGLILVDRGYEHEVLGEIKIERTEGFCDVEPPNKAAILQMLREEAFRRGANAVIFAESVMSESPVYAEACRYMPGPFGQGWAVRLGSAPTEQSAPSPMTL